MKTINFISKKIYSHLYKIEKEIINNSDKNAEYWAKSNSKRIAYYIKSISEFIESNQEKKSNKRIRILNASGIAAGQVDFTIIKFFKETSKPALDWHTIDSPDNSYLKNSFFQKNITDLSVNLEFIDFNKQYDLNNIFKQKFDIILFTEIAEHLDHSSLLEILQQISQLLSTKGILIFSTPNLLSFGQRIKMLRGTTKNIYWGDGIANYNKGLYGHITLYDSGRLKRLLNDVGLQTVECITFDYGYKKGIKAIISNILKNILSLIFLNSKSTIFLKAQKINNFVVMPFKI